MLLLLLLASDWPEELASFAAEAAAAMAVGAAVAEAVVEAAAP